MGPHCSSDVLSSNARTSPLLQVLVEILTELQLGSGFEVKLNHRRLLDAMLDIAGVPAQKFRCGSG